MNVIGEPIDEKGPLGKLSGEGKALTVTSAFVWKTAEALLAEARTLASGDQLHCLPVSPCFACPAESPHSLPIHREAPLFTDQSTEQEILETGIKVGTPQCYDIDVQQARTSQDVHVEAASPVLGTECIGDRLDACTCQAPFSFF